MSDIIDMRPLAEALNKSEKEPRVPIEAKLSEIREFVQTASEEQLAEALAQSVDHESNDSYEMFRALLLVVLQYYGRRKKEAGARGYAKLVDQMRQAQRTYFRTSSHSALAESKKLEGQVDLANKLVLKS